MFWETSQDNRYLIGYIAITRQDIDMYKAAIGGIQLAHNRPAIASPFDSNASRGDLNQPSGSNININNNNLHLNLNCDNNNQQHHHHQYHQINSSSPIDSQSTGEQQAHGQKGNHAQMLGPIGSGAPPSGSQSHSHLQAAAARMVMRSASLDQSQLLGAPTSTVRDQIPPTSIAPTTSTPAATAPSQNNYQQQPMGTIVEHVVPGSLMNIICKLKVGDEIVELNGVQLRNKSDVEVRQILESVKTSNTLRMVAIRQLDCSSPPASPRSPQSRMAPTLSPSPIQHHSNDAATSHHRHHRTHHNHNNQQHNFHNQQHATNHHHHQHDEHHRNQYQHHHHHQQHQHRNVT